MVAAPDGLWNRFSFDGLTELQKYQLVRPNTPSTFEIDNPRKTPILPTWFCLGTEIIEEMVDITSFYSMVGLRIPTVSKAQMTKTKTYSNDNARWKGGEIMRGSYKRENMH